MRVTSRSVQARRRGGARRFLGALLALLPVGAWAADPQITSMTDNPDPATAGGLYTYAVGIDNTDASAATNTVLTVSVPSGATFVSAAPANANCVATSATLVTCDIGALPGNGTGARTVNFTWRATAAGTINATATISADNDTNLANNTQNATTTVLAGADLRLTKTDSPDPVIGGANVTYTLTAFNDGPNASGNLVLTDNLPGSSTFVSASGTGWSCSHAAGVVTCTRNGPLAVGASAPPVTIVARIIASTGFVTNSATISPAAGATADPDTNNNTATATTSVLPGADVRIDSKSVAPNPVIAGENATFTLTPRNGGPAVANNVAVTDTLPSGWTFVSATGTGWSCSAAGQTVTCSRATYAVGGTNNITIIAKAPGNAVIGPTGRTDTNTATITTTDNDPAPGNNTRAVSFDILPDGADLRLAKSKSPNPVAQGSQVTSTITVTNGGPRQATGELRVVDQLSGETFVSATGAGWACTVNGSTVTCNHENNSGLNAGASLPVLEIVTVATVAGSATNQACTGSSLPTGAAIGTTARQPIEGDPNPTNDCNTASTSSTSVRPDLAITKTTSTPTGGDKIVSATEDRVTYTLVVTNVSPTAENATGVRISDTVPAFLASGTYQSSIVTPVVATVAGAGSTATFNCTVNNRETVICTQTGGVLAQGGTVTVPITVLRGMREGDFTNGGVVENTVEGDPDRSNNTAFDTVTIVPLADMQMTGKSITPGTVKAGEVATYVLSFRNNGPSTAQNVVVTDTFTFPAGDTGYTVTQITPSKGSCAVNAGTNPNGVNVNDVLGPARNAFTCQIGSMASGETQTVTLKGRPNFRSGNAARVFTNVADVTTTTAERPDGTDGGNNAQGPVTLNVDPAGLDLLVNKDDTGFDPIAYTSGNTFLSYRVNVTNNGPSFGTGVKVTETMTPPAGKRIRFVCDTATFGGSTCNTGPLALCSVSDVTSAAGVAIPAFTCDVPAGTATNGLSKGELAVGQTKSIFLRFEVLDNPSTSGDNFTNQATVSANEPDTLAANDTESEQTTVRRRVDLAVTKAAKKAGTPITTVALREPFEWEVVVTNNGPSESLQTILTDTLPAGSDIVGVISWTKTLPAASGTCPDSGVCTMGQLDALGQITITVPTRLSAYPSGGVATNSATVNTDADTIGGIDTTPLDNTATANVTVTRSSIAGTVFQDRVRDGANGGTPQAAAQEPRIQGVTVTLTGNDLFGDPVNATAVTDASGNYLLNNLPPSAAGGYTITQTQPAGFINGTVDPPTSGGSEPTNGGTYARGGTSGNSSFTGIVVGGDTAALRYNFPEIRQPTLSGFVYLDVNANDVRDPATDTPIAVATVRLLNATTLAQIATTTTGADGAYTFTGLDPLIAYTLEQPLPTTPANLRNGAVNPGQIGGVACATGCTAQPNTPAADTDRIAAIDLASGADGTVFNFGERQLAGVSGLVYVDKNRNNALDGSDTGRLAGVTVRLVQGASCAAGTELQSTTTAADGTYSFSGVLAFQNYLLCETQPVGYAVGNANGTAGSNQITLTNLAASGSANNNFGALVGSLVGSVYQDTGAGTAANFNNGVRDAGEPGIAGVTVTLTGTDATGAAVNRSVTTDASGNYSFDDLLTAGAGGYTVTEGAIPPAAGTFLDGKTTAGGAGGTATAVNTLPSAISAINLGAGVQTTGYIFGELPNGSISGTVYVDRNRNDTMDATPTDGRISGVTLTLRDGTSCSAGTVFGTTTTGADGSYSFSGIAGGGTYTICETQPVGYADGTVNPGTNGASSAANSITLTNLAASGSANNNFGERVGRLTGSVYVDFSAATPANTNNGIRDAGEAGIAGVTITLTGTDATGAAVNRTATTDANGDYAFDDLLTAGAGGYTVTEGAIPPAAGRFNDGKTTAGAAGGTATAVDTLPSAISAIALGAGVQTTGYIFGELPRAGITGTVYIDRNRNGTMDATPTDGRIAGVTLTLRQGTSCSAGTVLGTTTTDAEGQYAFNDLSAGLDYAVCETQPTGYADGTVNPGTNGASSAANTIVVTNLPGSGSANNNFGERVGRLTGSVYVDFSAATPANTNNGIRDAGEPGIAGVTITLTGTDATGAAVNRTATTDANGDYAFDDLLAAGAGGYTVTEGTIPPSAGSFNDGKTTAGAAGGTATAVNTLPSAISNIALGAGVQTTNYIFGELPRAGITGTVYIDRNRNNQLDAVPTDGRIAGVTLTLRQGTSCSAGTVLGTTTTDADGQYAFNDLSAGLDYAVCETQPVGYADGTVNPGTNGASSAANSITLTNLPGSGSGNNNFGALVGSLAGSVYQDTGAGTAANFNNGVRDAGEPGVAGVTVTLTGTDALGATVNRTATTDASGNYSFDDLLTAGAGGYTVTEGAIPPAAGTFLDGKTTAGGAGGTATAVNALPSAITGIALGAGVQTTGYIFGELPSTAIGGTVYIDRNRNDTLDPTPTDGRIAGVTLTLRDGSSCSAGTVLGTTTTGADGSYSFSAIAGGGTYTICETQPTGYADGTVNPGTNGTSSAANSITVTNLAGSGSANNHFGERVGSLAGAVYMDTDNDGQKDPGEPGLAGVSVTLTGSDATGAPVNRSATTDAAGDYRFDDLLAAGAGGYTVTEQATQPVFEGKATINGRTTAGSTGGSATAVTTLPSAISAIPLAAGADSTAHLFGELLSVGLSGTVFADLANDGVQQLPNDLGLGGVTLDLTGTDDLGTAVSATTTTAADGTYSFTGLRPGTYTVTEPTQPPGTVNGITTAGTLGGTATPVATLPSVISGIPLVTSGAFSTGNNFAEIPNNSGVGGRVWLDLDNDGAIDAGENGIAGVTVTLTGTDTIGRPVERTLTTDAQGGYLFEELAPGSYTVTEPTQPVGTLNGLTVVGNGGGTATPVATLPSAISGITLGIGQMVTANNFGEIPPARIAGRVYADNNDNGAIDSGEVGLAGVSLVLTGTDDLGVAVNRTLSSGADGGYVFENLRPGTYTVTEPTQPAGTVNGLTTAGTLGGTATPVTTLPSAISGIVVPVGGAGTGYNFGELANSPDLRVTKTHAEPIFTVTKPATYAIRVLNLGEIATSGAYTVEDRLPAGLTLASTPTGTGWICTGAPGASSFNCSSSTVIAAGATNPNTITAIAVVGTAALNAPIANNAVLVEGGGEIPARRPTPAERDAFINNPASLPECSAAPPRNVCRDPEEVQQSANLSGTVWYDIGTVQRQLDARDQRKQGWIVEVIDVNGVDPSRPNAAGERVVVASGGTGNGDGDARPTAGGTPGAVVARAFTKVDGTYLIENLIPNIDYAIRFRDPNSNVVFGYPVNGERGPGSSGAQCLDRNKPVNLESSCVDAGALPQLTVRLAPGRNLVQQSLPIDPSGVVYDSGLRTPIPGATVSLAPVGACAAWDPTDDIVGATLGGYSVSGNAISMVTGADGLYQFLLSPAAPARCNFALTVTPPSGYSFISKLIAPTPGPLSPPGGPGAFFNVQPQAEPPTGPVGPATTYYLSLSAGSAAPNILHNHIPLDPALPGTVLLDKTGDRSVVEVGDSVRYSITVSVPSGALPRQTTVVDRLPAGFTYIPGTATVDDRPIADPQGGVGPTLAFNLGRMGDTRQQVLRYRVRVGVGAQEGDGVNRAQAQSCGVPTGCVDGGFNPLPGSVATNEDRYRVRVTGGVFGTEACVLGKVFVDCNNNHSQDPEELGIPGVRMVMSDGTTLISDSEGKYSVCGLEPKSMVMRVDPRTLPRGARMTTSSNRNLGDAGSLWLDLKNGELHRADFIEGSCAAPVIDQVKGRRAQGEIRAPETERKDGPALRFDSDGPYIGPVRPREGERVTPVGAQQKGGAHGAP